MLDFARSPLLNGFLAEKMTENARSLRPVCPALLIAWKLDAFKSLVSQGLILRNPGSYHT